MATEHTPFIPLEDAVTPPEKPSPEPPSHARRLFLRLSTTFLGGTAALLGLRRFGLAPTTGTAAAAGAESDMGPRTKDAGVGVEAVRTPETLRRDEYQQALWQFAQEAVAAAKADQGNISFQSETGGPLTITRQEFMAQVTHDEAAAALIAYFVDHAMVNLPAADPNNQALIQEKLTKLTKESQSWNTSYTARFSVIVNRVLTDWEEHIQQTHIPETPLTDDPRSPHRSQLRRLLLYLLDVQHGHQPDLPEYSAQVTKILLHILTQLPEEIIAARSSATPDPTANPPQPILQTSAGPRYLNLDGLITDLNLQFFSEYRQKDYNPATAPTTRRQFLLDWMRLPSQRQVYATQFREQVAADLSTVPTDPAQ